MNAVITREQARTVLKGRDPHVLIEYEQAVNALQACITLDEAKYWSDKSDALAAWARIYRDDDAGRKARQVKLHAFRRMGEIAKELRPGTGKGKGRKDTGCYSLLMDSGLSRSAAQAARTLAKIDEPIFQKFIDQRRPPSPQTARTILGIGDGPWREFQTRGVLACSSFCKTSSAVHVAKLVDKKDVERARLLARTISEWFDDFERHLPK